MACRAAQPEKPDSGVLARVLDDLAVVGQRCRRAALRFRCFHVPARGGFDARMGDSVIAFHKAYGRPRTTTFEASVWVRLTKRRVAARDRSRALHIEIDKSRQILMQVKNGRQEVIDMVPPLKASMADVAAKQQAAAAITKTKPAAAKPAAAASASKTTKPAPKTGT